MRHFRFVAPSVALGVVVGWLGMVAGATTPAAAQDPAQVGPTIYKQLSENERIRVFEVTFKPKAEIGLHSHPDHALYILSGGKLRVTAADGQATDLDLVAGQTVFLSAQTHSAKNVGKSTIRVLVTELKESAPSGSLGIEGRTFLLDLLERSRRETEELVAKTPDELWAKKPAPERWSVSEVVEHLALAEGLLFGLSQQALAQPVDPNWALVAGRVTAEQQLAFLGDRSKKFQAPEPAQPKGGLSRADALAKFGGTREVTSEFVRRTSDAVDKHVATLPIGQMTAHQILTMIGGHNLRHNQQIVETLAALQTP